MFEPYHRIELLLIEDNPADVSLTQRALSHTRSAPHVSVVRDGDEAMAFLRHKDPYEAAPRPDLIFLDLNVPKRDGRTLLADLKSDPDLRNIPVIVLTTSEADEDISQAYDLYANCYVKKPVEMQRFIEMIQSVEEFWLNVVRLPTA
ncbi:MAG TPA: response regulator [Bryobacteraceae bacterium]|jgi:CheY-like chemotaxis protein|nr:response regulator [Bryobacteraceae bacterium]